MFDRLVCANGLEGRTAAFFNYGDHAWDERDEDGRPVYLAHNQAEDMARDDEFMRGFDAWTDRFTAFVARKGKVPPGRYRAFGYKPPGHRWADVKLTLREGGRGRPAAALTT